MHPFQKAWFENFGRKCATLHALVIMCSSKSYYRKDRTTAAQLD